LARCGTMLKAKVAPSDPVRHGRLTDFLRRDLFSVKLDNGVTITAVMPGSHGLFRHTIARSLDDGKGRPTTRPATHGRTALRSI
jgi:hypothetical protein